MTEPARVPAHRRYEIVAYGRSETPIYYEEIGDYSGEWLMLARSPSPVLFMLYKDSYGSCSGCDSYEAEVSRFDAGVTLEAARAFAEQYKPFLAIPQETMRGLCDARTLVEVLPKNVHDEYSRAGSLENIAATFILAAKIDQGWPILYEDIGPARNQELRARALKAFGYDKWIERSGAMVVDRRGEDELVKAGDEVFLHLKDASTDRRYLLRVPPRDDQRHRMVRVRQAVAWTFGLGEDAYNPDQET